MKKKKKKSSLSSYMSANKVLAGGPFHVGTLPRYQILYTGLTRHNRKSKVK